MTESPVVVAGATGMQGNGVARALLREGFAVRALTRNARSPAARALAEAGASLVEGDFEDCASLDKAMRGARAVFSVQLPATPGDPESEVRTARNLLTAAKDAGVVQLVHTSVARAGDHESFAGWSEGRWGRGYWQAKAEVNQLVKAASFAHWTIFKPAFYMENFIPPRAAWLYPGLERGHIYAAMPAETRQFLVSVKVLSAFALAAFKDPARFDRQEVPLACETLTMAEIAAIISKASARAVTSHAMSLDEAVAVGVSRPVAMAQAWAAVEGYNVDLEQVRRHGIALDSFADFARRHATDFDIS